jgi:hypothetical protein
VARYSRAAAGAIRAQVKRDLGGAQRRPQQMPLDELAVGLRDRFRVSAVALQMAADGADHHCLQHGGRHPAERSAGLSPKHSLLPLPDVAFQAAAGQNPERAEGALQPSRPAQRFSDFRFHDPETGSTTARDRLESKAPRHTKSGSGTEMNKLKIMTRARQPGKKRLRATKMSEPELDTLIEEATVDAYEESEQTVGFHTMLIERLEMPFKTELLGVEVTVEQVDLSDDDQIVVVCKRGKLRQRIPILELPLPKPPPKGSEWIDAYRRWARGR